MGGVRLIRFFIALLTGVLLVAGASVETEAASTFVVNSTADPGNGICDFAECTLREAIDAANAEPDADNIHFNIPGAGPHAIVSSQNDWLGLITEPVSIDASTQPGFDGSPVIELTGAPGGTDLGFGVEANGVAIRGFAINDFSVGVSLLFASGTVIEGNFIGTDTSGVNAVGNDIGIHLEASNSNYVGGGGTNARNVISGNDVGVAIESGSANNYILGNYIGLDRTGSAALGNETGIIVLFANTNYIGGISAGEGNVISGNLNEGVHVAGSESNVVVGNKIGTNASGSASVPNFLGVLVSFDAGGTTIGGSEVGARNVISGNMGVGIAINANDNQVVGNFIGTDQTGSFALGNEVGLSIVGSVSNIVGGAGEGAGNLISGNETGMQILGDDNDIIGNLIGTNAAGTAALGSQLEGINIQGTGNLVGGSGPGDGNIVGGNTGHGVFLAGTGNAVQGNWIGTTPSGESVPNGLGVEAGQSGNLVGGTGPGHGNTIAFNIGAGVEGIPTSIRGNSIHSNGGKGITNVNGTPSPPTVTSVGPSAGTSCANCIIDVFSDDDDEGRVYHGSTVADATGNWSFAGPVSGPNVTATATDQSDNTSEFSSPIVVSTPEPTPAPVGGSVELTVASTDASTSIGLFAIIPSTLAAALAFAALRSTRRTRA